MAKNKIESPLFGLIGNRNAVYAPALFEALKPITGIQKKKSSLPVLNHCLLEFGESLKFYCTNLEDNYSSEIIYNSKGDKFSTCVPTFWHGEVIKGYASGGHAIYGEKTLRPFLDYIKLLAQNKEWFIVEFDSKTQTLKVLSGAKLESRAQFKCMDAQEFPAVSKT